MPAAKYSSVLTARVEEQLGRFGIAGRVEQQGRQLRLVGHGRSVVIEREDLDAWGSAEPARRDEIVEAIVRELVRARRLHAGGSKEAFAPAAWFKPLAVLVLTSLGIWSAWQWLGKPARDALIASNARRIASANPVSSANSSRLLAAVEVNPSEACERVQARIATGGNVSPLDRDGWVVEFMLSSVDERLSPASPALDGFLSTPSSAGSTAQPRQLIWEQDEVLRQLNDAESFAVVTPEPLAGVLASVKGGIRIVWSSRFAGAYFDETKRSRFQRLAAAMYEATGATMGALYARCSANSVHQVGSWFRGNDLGTAALSMLVAMGSHAPVPHVNGADPRTSSAIEQRRVWDAVALRAKKLERSNFTMLLGEDGGMMASKQGGWVTLSFPFQDGNRATRASLRLAQRLGVAPKY